MVGKEQVDLFTGARSNNVALVDAAIRRGAQINWQFDRWEGPSWGLKVPIHVFGVYWGVNVRERWRAPPGVEVSRGDTLLIIALKLGMSDLVRRICRCEDLRCELKNEAGNDAWAIAELVHMSQWLPPPPAWRQLAQQQPMTASFVVGPSGAVHATPPGAYSQSIAAPVGIYVASDPSYAPMVAQPYGVAPPAYPVPVATVVEATPQLPPYPSGSGYSR